MRKCKKMVASQSLLASCRRDICLICQNAEATSGGCDGRKRSAPNICFLFDKAEKVLKRESVVSV
jgi:hypothetical protein